MSQFGKTGKKFTTDMLSQEELNRYSRHIIMPEIGKAGQEKLKKAKVLVIGAGGLGCPALQYLTAAGVGTVGIIDFDVVEDSNLQRQVLFNVDDIGLSKAKAAAEKLKLQNPFVECRIFQEKLESGNALEIIDQFDLVVDGCDNFATRYLVNDACVILGKPFVFGSIFKFEGQVSVFNYTDRNGNIGPTYRCLFPEPPGEDEAPNCATIGVLGVLPGIVGSLQANEAIKLITGIGDPLSGRLLIMDAMEMQFRAIKFKAVAENHQIKNLSENYEELCKINVGNENNAHKEISVEELKEKLDAGEEIVLIDVREDYEYEICNLGGQLIPMNTIPSNVHLIPKDRPVVMYCHHGSRSEWAVKYLMQEHQFTNLINLSGGIHQWALDIDEEMEVY